MVIFGENPTLGSRDRIEYIGFKVSTLMKIDTFSKRYFKQNSLLQRVDIEKIYHQIHHFNLYRNVYMTAIKFEEEIELKI